MLHRSPCSINFLAPVFSVQGSDKVPDSSCGRESMNFPSPLKSLPNNQEALDDEHVADGVEVQNNAAEIMAPNKDGRRRGYTGHP